MARAVLAMSGASAVACYVGYPAALAIRARFATVPIRTGLAELPSTISVVIAAFDEEADIEQKLDDLASQDFSSESLSSNNREAGPTLEVIVASDGSTDATVELASAHSSRPRVLDLPRRGKAAALNDAINYCRGEIVVFTDANSRLDPTAIPRLLEPFTDPDVGGVAGDQRYGKSASAAGESERHYWGYERTLKRLESACGSVVSSTGALHAVRREFIEPVPPDVTDDFYLSTGVVVHGHRLIFAPDAMAWEQPGESGRAEYRRKVRIITRGLTGVRRRANLLDPRHDSLYAMVLFMHKIARRLMFVPLLAAFIAAYRLRRQSRVEGAFWWGQVGFYSAALVGVAASESPIGRFPAFSLPAHFVRTNTAAAHAVINVIRSKRFETWDHHRT